MNPSTVPNIRLRQPRRLASQWVMGVATAVATRLRVNHQQDQPLAPTDAENSALVGLLAHGVQTFRGLSRRFAPTLSSIRCLGDPEATGHHARRARDAATARRASHARSSQSPAARRLLLHRRRREHEVSARHVRLGGSRAARARVSRRQAASHQDTTAVTGQSGEEVRDKSLKR